MNRTTIRILNGGLLVLCCFLAARVIAAVAGETLAPAPVDEAAPPAVRVARDTTWNERQVILDRNLFNVSTHGGQVKIADQEPEEEYEKTKLPLRLLGTAAAADPRQSRAAIENTTDRKHRVVREGDVVADQAQVVRIERRRLVLQNGPRREELGLDETDTAAPRPVAARRTARATRPTPSQRRRAAIERLGENRYAVDRSDVESVANNPAALFSQARILPKYEEGEMVGVQLNAIQAGSLFEQIGIQDGDTITELNGIRVTGQQESAEVLRELTQSQEFNVTVTGQDGAVRQLRYEIR